MSEKVQWGLTILNTLSTFKDIAESFGKIHKELPPEWKQRLPGLLGLSLADEQIFNGVLGQLKTPQQTVIMHFLYSMCENFQRNRFINIVAGMDVEKGTPSTKERSWDKKSGKSVEKTISGAPKKDRRQEFLESFAQIIMDKGYVETYKYAIGTRLILSKSAHQRASEQLQKLTAVAGKAGEKAGEVFVKGLDEIEKELETSNTEREKDLTDILVQVKAWRDKNR